MRPRQKGKRGKLACQHAAASELLAQQVSRFPVHDTDIKLNQQRKSNLDINIIIMQTDKNLALGS